PAFAESTAAPGCGRTGRRAHAGRFRILMGPMGPFIFMALFCGMPSCSSRQALARLGRLNSRKKFPFLLIYALCCMLHIASCKLLFHGEADSLFALCVFFLARALFSFRYY
ncbi:hypothetical protein, partial [uncultured Slackia sp.]|uniref:hypothetical protein n=1 Tax=uncultured Slackia sp. TaxID=665903 RepID=UPI0025D6E057